MTKTNLSLGVLLMSGLFMACASKGGGGTAGSNGNAGSGSGGSNGSAGNGSAGSGTAGAGLAGMGMCAMFDQAVGADGGAPITTDASATQADGKCVSGAFSRDGGPCTCQGDRPAVCGAKCYNLQTDPLNCGACGNVCTGASVCVSGQCSAQPKSVLAPAAGCGIVHLVVSGTSIIYTDKTHGTVSSVPAAGGTATSLATGQMGPTLIALNGSTLFWLNSTSKSIVKAPLAGTPVTNLITETGDINGFAVSADGGTVYYSTASKINKVSASGGAATLVATEVKQGVPGNLGLDGTHLVYATNHNGDVDVVTLADGKMAQCGIDPPSGGEAYGIMCNRIARSQGQLFFDLLDTARGPSIYMMGGKAYWIDGSSVKAADGVTTTPSAEANGTAYAISTCASTAITDSYGGGKFSAFTLSGSTAYLGEADLNNTTSLNGFVEKVNLDGSGKKPLAHLAGPPNSIGVDGSNVYWSADDCGIYSVPK
jgi:hypothetical protein